MFKNALRNVFFPYLICGEGRCSLFGKQCFLRNASFLLHWDLLSSGIYLGRFCSTRILFIYLIFLNMDIWYDCWWRFLQRGYCLFWENIDFLGGFAQRILFICTKHSWFLMCFSQWGFCIFTENILILGFLNADILHVWLLMS